MTSGGGDEPRFVGDALDALLGSLKGGGRKELGGVFGTWDEAVGTAIAAHVRPIRLDAGVLTVNVDEPAWATQVRLLDGDIRARVHAACGVDLERIEVRVGRPSSDR